MSITLSASDAAEIEAALERAEQFIDTEREARALGGFDADDQYLGEPTQLTDEIRSTLAKLRAARAAQAELSADEMREAAAALVEQHQRSYDKGGANGKADACLWLALAIRDLPLTKELGR